MTVHIYYLMMYSCHYNPLFVILPPIFSEGIAAIMKRNICSKLANLHVVVKTALTIDKFHFIEFDKNSRKIAIYNLLECVSQGHGYGCQWHSLYEEKSFKTLKVQPIHFPNHKRTLKPFQCILFEVELFLDPSCQKKP